MESVGSHHRYLRVRHRFVRAALDDIDAGGEGNGERRCERCHAVERATVRAHHVDEGQRVRRAGGDGHLTLVRHHYRTSVRGIVHFHVLRGCLGGEDEVASGGVACHLRGGDAVLCVQCQRRNLSRQVVQERERFVERVQSFEREECRFVRAAVDAEWEAVHGAALVDGGSLVTSHRIDSRSVRLCGVEQGFQVFSSVKVVLAFRFLHHNRFAAQVASARHDLQGGSEGCEGRSRCTEDGLRGSCRGLHRGCEVGSEGRAGGGGFHEESLSRSQDAVGGERSFSVGSHPSGGVVAAHHRCLSRGGQNPIFLLQSRVGCKELGHVEPAGEGVAQEEEPVVCHLVRGGEAERAVAVVREEASRLFADSVNTGGVASRGVVIDEVVVGRVFLRHTEEQLGVGCSRLV